MTLVSTVTVGSGGAASIEFTGIAGTGKDLLLLVSSRADNFNGKLTFNGNTSSYSYRNLYGSGSAATSGNDSGASALTILALHEPKDFNGVNNTVGIVSNGSIYISNYAGSANKSVSVDTVIEFNGTESYQTLLAGLWANSAAITSVKIESNSGNILQHSSVSLYIIS